MVAQAIAMKRCKTKPEFDQLLLVTTAQAKEQRVIGALELFVRFKPQQYAAQLVKRIYGRRVRG